MTDFKSILIDLGLYSWHLIYMTDFKSILIDLGLIQLTSDLYDWLQVNIDWPWLNTADIRSIWLTSSQYWLTLALYSWHLIYMTDFKLILIDLGLIQLTSDLYDWLQVNIDWPWLNTADIQPIWLTSFVCFVALRPKSTAMVMAGRSVHQNTLFPGQAWTSS